MPPSEKMGDLFFASRLQALVAAGRVEALGRRKRLREYTVRLGEPDVAKGGTARYSLRLFR